MLARFTKTRMNQYIAGGGSQEVYALVLSVGKEGAIGAQCIEDMEKFAEMEPNTIAKMVDRMIQKGSDIEFVSHWGINHQQGFVVCSRDQFVIDELLEELTPFNLAFKFRGF